MSNTCACGPACTCGPTCNCGPEGRCNPACRCGEGTTRGWLGWLARLLPGRECCAAPRAA